jgi:hypothetical protein
MFRSLKNMLTPKRDRVSPPPVVNTDSNAKHLKPADEVVSREEAAAITLQKNIRGFIARKKYGIKQLTRYEMDSYETFVVGNDPKMPASLANYHVADEKIALVATSGVRALSIACELGNSGHTPKIFLIDNSREVCEFWLQLRAFASDDVACGTAQKFLDKLPEFLARNAQLYRDIPDRALQNRNNSGAKYPNQNIRRFFTRLIDKHGYEYVRAVLLHASVIKQSWADAETFAKVKNILSLHGIKKVFMYPSNIVGCIEHQNGGDVLQQKVLENIQATAPVMTIHTDCVGFLSGHPEHVFLLENQEPRYVKSQLSPDDDEPGMGGGMFGMFSSGTGMPGGVIVVHDIGDLLMLLQMTHGNRQQRDDHDRHDSFCRSPGFGGW